MTRLCRDFFDNTQKNLFRVGIHVPCATLSYSSKRPVLSLYIHFYYVKVIKIKLYRMKLQLFFFLTGDKI